MKFFLSAILAFVAFHGAIADDESSLRFLRKKSKPQSSTNTCVGDNDCIGVPSENKCYTATYCPRGTCVPDQSTVVDCDDSDPCTTDSCDPDIGCVNTPIAGCDNDTNPQDVVPCTDSSDCAQPSDWCSVATCENSSCVIGPRCESDQSCDAVAQKCIDYCDILGLCRNVGNCREGSSWSQWCQQCKGPNGGCYDITASGHAGGCQCR